MTLMDFAAARAAKDEKARAAEETRQARASYKAKTAADLKPVLTALGATAAAELRSRGVPTKLVDGLLGWTFWGSRLPGLTFLDVQGELGDFGRSRGIHGGLLSRARDRPRGEVWWTEAGEVYVTWREENADGWDWTTTHVDDKSLKLVMSLVRQHEQGRD